MNDVKELAKLVRSNIVRSTTAAGSGHPSSSLSAADLMTVLLFGGFFRADLENPAYHNNDRLIFSKGHAAPLLYSLYAAAGKISEQELLTLRKLGSRLEGHPTMEFPYTEAATGSLGQGLSIGVGMALAGKLDKLPYRTYVLLGDSEMAEGSVWEAMEVASFYKLDNLVAIVDVNRLGQRGQTMLGYKTADYAKRAAAFGWKTFVIDGHNVKQIVSAFAKALKVRGAPVMIIAKTVKGKGVKFIENKDGWHGKAIAKDDLEKAFKSIGVVKDGLRGTVAEPKKVSLSDSTVAKIDASAYTIGEIVSTRKAYGNAIARIAKSDARVVALDAEVSNSTYAEFVKKDTPKQFLEMFIAEQNMVGAALGLARRGKIPFVSTFAAFLTRAADQIRMSQYSDAQVKFVGSHTGVSIGQDGASQMALEDLALFRANLHSVVLYPSDATSTAALAVAAYKHTGLVYVRTTRQDTPVLYSANESFPIGGSKVLRSSNADVATIVAAGITLHEALKAYDMLKQKGVNVRVIDLYSVKPLDVETLKKAAQETKHVITVEDHFAEGGIGEAVAAAIAGESVALTMLAVQKMPHSGTPEELLAEQGIDSAAIVAIVATHKH